MEFLANPSAVRQAPDHKTLNKTSQLLLDSIPLSTIPTAQQYFEPGVNVSLKKRTKPKTNYTLPSDLPSYPLGFVPVNQTPSANGEEPPIIKVKESVPADLIEVFARINAEQKLAESMPKHTVDVGSQLMREYTDALRSLKDEARMENLRREGFTQEETEKALQTLRMEAAMKKAKEPAVVSGSVESALAESFGRFVEVPEGKRAIVVPEDRLTPAERLAKETLPQVLAGKQATLKGFLKSGE